MHTAVIDIESTTFENTLSEIDKIFCIGVKIDDQPTKVFTNVYIKGSDGNLNSALNLINQCSYVIGHNIIKFDIPGLFSGSNLTFISESVVLDIIFFLITDRSSRSLITPF